MPMNIGSAPTICRSSIKGPSVVWVSATCFGLRPPPFTDTPTTDSHLDCRYARILSVAAHRGKAELAALQHLFQYSIDAKPLPQAPEQQRAADSAGCDPACIDIGQNDATLCVTCDRGGKSVEFATRCQHIIAAQSLDRDRKSTRMNSSH